ncbi:MULTISPECIES: hypothetical protein [Staphylococcus]|uniref:ORF101 n=2 Tax=root TaxID=1 RepID=Q4ZC10_9CAUD|nr:MULTISPECIES: hypothetical protein [Staphylococcus]YP_240216.1 ORF101 [Staphylococcus phage EW]AAX91404.1 ORF101 [Staphylococcus phage EW]NHM91308.1 hypothetical protein [Staphylococcus sp. 10602379]NHM92949.1 hypothetical protein [Staphylococcus sp. 10602379]NJI02256.1 hypothetical protein [Staphylococcus agnetis]NJI03088.1 hypothetical protein [Staphylococcus agnetis]
MGLLDRFYLYKNDKPVVSVIPQHGKYYVCGYGFNGYFYLNDYMTEDELEQFIADKGLSR